MPLGCRYQPPGCKQSDAVDEWSEEVGNVDEDQQDPERPSLAPMVEIDNYLWQ
jgi:hypothetical protein